MWLDTRLVPVKNATGEVKTILGIARDITERKLGEGQMRRTQRLESIGTLASKVKGSVKGKGVSKGVIKGKGKGVSS